MCACVWKEEREEREDGRERNKERIDVKRKLRIFRRSEVDAAQNSVVCLQSMVKGAMWRAKCDDICF